MSSKDMPLYMNNALPTKDRVEDLVCQMTLEEKISQMIHDAPAIERLGIPAYNWWNEGLHGLGRAGTATVFPQAIGLAATWNPDLMFRLATAVSDEARAKHHEALRRGIHYIYTGLTIWSPNINIFRDPRWGRGQETYGEDPYLTASLGVPFVKGLQGDNPDYLKVIATPKHFAVHSGPESLRHSFDALASEQDMRETYLPHFEACVKEAKAYSVMGAYNRTNGEACCASPTLLQQILREEWGFEGFVVSDCMAIYDIFAYHKIVETAEEAAALAVKNGCELNCGQTYSALLGAVEKGFITEEIINQAVQRLLVARFRLGMFDLPEKVPYAKIPYEIINSPEHQALTLEAARESMVLLKNEANFLPLAKDVQSIAVIGPNAHELQSLLGNYHGTAVNATTPLTGIRKKVSPSTKIYYAQGSPFADGIPAMQVIPATYLYSTDDHAAESGLTASFFDNPKFEGEPVRSQVHPQIDFIWKDTTPLTGQWGEDFSIQWSGYLVPPASGTYTLGANGFSEFTLYLDDEQIVYYRDIHHPRIKAKEVELEAGRFYKIRLDYISQGIDPQIQLLWSLPEVDYQTPALEIANKADVIVAVMGLSPNLEGEEMPVHIDGFTGGDRTDIKLPSVQLELLEKLHATGKPIVLVLLNGSALGIKWAAENVPAIVEAWYPGEAGGQALADVLFGDYNPAGRLPVTFYESVDDLPPFEDYAMNGRTYRFFQGKPIFPFGHGLSYTTFKFDNLQIEHSDVKAGDQIAIRADITNTGNMTGDEVVQLYVRQPTNPGRPIKELKGFKRINLQPGECKTVTFIVQINQLGVYDKALMYAIHPGTVDVMIGNSSEHLPLKGQFDITGQPTSVSEQKVFFSQVEI